MAHRRRFTPSGTRRWRCPDCIWHFVDVVWIFLFPLPLPRGPGTSGRLEGGRSRFAEKGLLHDLRVADGADGHHGFVAFIPLGRLNFPVALSIAILKATLVLLFFMHVKYSSRLTKLVCGTAFFSPGSLRPDLVRLSVARLVHGARWDDRREYAGQNRSRSAGTRRALNRTHALSIKPAA